GQIARVLELRDAAAREAHRPRDVEEHAEIRVRVRFVLLDVVAVGARVEPPVDAADVVARYIAPVFREIDRRAEVRRAMESVDETVDDGPREQIEVPDPREDRGVDEPGSR